MNAIDHEIRRAQAAVQRGVITRYELARQAKVRQSTLERMLEPDWNPTRKTLSAIVIVLDRIGFFSPNNDRGRKAPADAAA